jgi:hypothetical protein
MSRSPAWWLALGLLIANDHLLKGAGLLPGWLTGKLSDVAGLIVAPVLAAALLRAGRARTRALAFALVAVPFVAIKLSPAAARGLVALVGALGIRWRIWCDPTDLLALAALPLAWRLARGATASVPRPDRAARWRRVFGVALASVACLATSISIPGYRTSAYVANMTRDPVDVRIYRVAGALDCTQLATTPQIALAAPFVAERCMHLDPGKIAPIDRVWWPLDPVRYRDPGTEPPEPPCDAVIVRVHGLPDTLLAWQAMDDVDVEEPVGDRAHDALDPQGVYLEPAGDRLLLAGSSRISAAPSTIALPDIACWTIDGGWSW